MQSFGVLRIPKHDRLGRGRAGGIDHLAPTAVQPRGIFRHRPANSVRRTIGATGRGESGVGRSRRCHVAELRLPCRTTTVAMFAQPQLPSQVKVSDCHFLDNYSCCHVWSGLLQLP